MKILNLKGLRRYFKSSCKNKTIPKKDILGSTEGLKYFAGLWGDKKSELMSMLTIIEYEYIQDNNFSSEQIMSVKQVLGKIAIFTKECKTEYEELLAEQRKREAHQVSTVQKDS